MLPSAWREACRKEEYYVDTFSGKSVIVTGAASGIGRATAGAFARRGANLVLADLDESAGAEVANELRAFGGEVVFVRTNVAQPEDCERMVSVAKDRFGRLDAAFNNAGIADSVPTPATHEYPLERWRKILDIDLSGVFYCLHFELPLMLVTGGAIVNTASMQAFKSYPGTPAYTAAKAGVVALTKVIGGEYADRGIRCNAVAPGIVATPINADILALPEWCDRLVGSIPQGRVGQAEELAEAVVWLCSAAASYVNGVCLPVDGGMLVR